MQIKTFTAKSSKAVLAMIKDELGPDAVILDTEEQDGSITMTAALERAPSAVLPEGDAFLWDGAGSAHGQGAAPFAAAYGGGAMSFAPDEQPGPTYSARGRLKAPVKEEPAAAQGEPGMEPAARPNTAHPNTARPNPARPAPARQRPAAEAAAPPPWTYAAPPQGLRQWQDEWSSIKNHILALMKPALRLDRLAPRQRLAVEFLQREGVDDVALLHLYRELSDNEQCSILAPLSRMVGVSAWCTENWPERIQLVAGPFGAGKTTVAMRLALALRRIEPGLRICLVNADATRGNGRLLLRHYCDLSDFSYKEASNTLELVAALNEALREGFDRVLVDLPGLSRGRYLASLVTDAGLATMTSGGTDDIAVHLTVAPHFGALQMQGIIERYRVPCRGSLVWTKLDEAEHFGQLVNMGVASGLPVSALSFGPGLGNSLVAAEANMLWRLLFKRELPG